MTGPEHYGEAEKLMNSLHGPRDAHPELDASIVAEAQVHATLALAAAAALGAVIPISHGNHPGAAREWLNATGVVDEL
jgi:hypothetical protein